jgi:hypothetical protein
MNHTQLKNIFTFLLIIVVQSLFFLKNKWFVAFIGSYYGADVNKISGYDFKLKDLFREDLGLISLFILIIFILIDIIVLYVLIKNYKKTTGLKISSPSESLSRGLRRQ